MSKIARRNISERRSGVVFLMKKVQTPRTDPTLQGPLLMTSPLSFGVISIKIPGAQRNPWVLFLLGPQLRTSPSGLNFDEKTHCANLGENKGEAKNINLIAKRRVRLRVF